MTENQDFLVISVVGQQGVGKSSILNEIAAAYGPPKEDQPDVSLTLTSSVPLGSTPRSPFALQSAEVALEAAHQTVGVDLHVTSDRLVLLDCQPVLSSSVALDMTLEAAPLPPHANVCISLSLSFYLPIFSPSLSLPLCPSLLPLSCGDIFLGRRKGLIQ